jgi:hypothetical protein
MSSKTFLVFVFFYFFNYIVKEKQEKFLFEFLNHLKNGLTLRKKTTSPPICNKGYLNEKE